MKDLFRALVLFLGFLASVKSLQAGGCSTILIDHRGLFITCPFIKVPPFKANLLTSNLEFSLGTEHVANCNNSEMVWATLRQGGALCADVATEDPSYDLIDTNKPALGYKTVFPENVIDNTIYQVIVTIECDDQVTNPLQTKFQITSITPSIVTFEDIPQNKQTINVSGRSYYGCPVVSLGSLYQNIAKGRTFILIIVAIIGLIICFFGYKIFKPTAFILITVLGTMLFGAFLTSYGSFGNEAGVLWLALIFSFIMGLIVGLTSLKYPPFTYFVMGGILGLIAGTLLYQAILAPILKDSAGTIPLFILVIVFALIGGLICLRFHQEVVIFSTAVIGSYIFIRMLGILLGGFPSEQSLADGTTRWNGVVFAYIAGFIILAFAGINFQNWFNEKPKSEKRYEAHEDPEREAFVSRR